jgi:transcriptional regulator with XRE-family HTH domain
MPEEIARVFGENVRRARKQAGLSQEEAAVRASLHRTEIGLLERAERTPRIDTAVKLAGAVGVPIGELLGDVEWNPGSVTRGRFELSPAPEDSP